MTPEDRDRLHAHLSALCDRYGPWAVLWVVVQALRPAFKAVEAKRPKQPRRTGKPEGRS